MRIFFTAAIAGMDKYGDSYKVIVEELENLGHSVNSEHILRADRDEIRGEGDDEVRVEWYKRVLKMISSADIVVAEVSAPSTNVGHEVSLALDKGKPVVAVYKRGHHPVLLMGIQSERFLLEEYETADQLRKDLKGYVEYSQDQQDTRFNFFISPKIAAYLDWVSKSQRVPRAVYLRKLIKEKMKAEEDYEG